MTPPPEAPAASRALTNSERTLIDTRPPVRSILVGVTGLLVLLFALALAGLAAAMTSWLASSTGFTIFFVCVGLGLLVLVWRAIDRDCRRYTLTTRSAAARLGVFRTAEIGVPLEHINNVVVTRLVIERLLGLGTVSMLSANGNVEVTWWAIAAPDRHARLVMRQLHRTRLSHVRMIKTPAASSQQGPWRQPMTGSMPSGDHPSRTSTGPRTPVIGIAGGIGAGKSTIAEAFESLNCHVIDSDVRAKAALDRPEISHQLVEWWGPTVLGADGRINRANVARIIFADASERKRLESIVHPIVRQDRARMIDEARQAGAAAVIVDAPLLFEAGIDAECDAVVFVDAPYEQRLERVRASRGWDEAELARREASQIPLEEKRERCRYIVHNSGTRGQILQQAQSILAELRAELSRPRN
jgi:dephospho-CoA kinase